MMKRSNSMGWHIPMLKGRHSAVIRTKGKGLLLPLLLGTTIATLICQFQARFEYSSLFLISAMVLIPSCCVMHRAIGVFHLRRLTIPGLWYLAYLSMIFVPSFFVFVAQDHPAKYMYFSAVLISLITVPLGVILASSIFAFQKAKIDEFYEKPIDANYSFPFVSTLMLFNMGAILLTAIYFYEVKTIPLLYAIKHPGDYYTLLVLREESFKLLDSPLVYFYFLLRQVGYPVLIALNWGMYVVSGKRQFLFAFIVMLCVGLFYTSASLIRGPAAVIVLSLFLVWYLYRGGNIKIVGFLAAAVVLALSIPIFILYLHSPDRPFWGVLQSVSERLFLTPAQVLYYYFEIFPGNVGYLYGRSIDKLAVLLNLFSGRFEYFDSANYVFNYMFPNALIKTGTAASPFLGDLNANFGPIGIIVGGVALGFVMQSLQIWVYNQNKKDVLLLTIHAMLFYSFWECNRTSLTTVLISYGGLTVPLFFYIYRWARQLMTVRR